MSGLLSLRPLLLFPETISHVSMDALPGFSTLAGLLPYMFGTIARKVPGTLGMSRDAGSAPWGVATLVVALDCAGADIERLEVRGGEQFLLWAPVPPVSDLPTRSSVSGCRPVPLATLGWGETWLMAVTLVWNCLPCSVTLLCLKFPFLPSDEVPVPSVLARWRFFLPSATSLPTHSSPEPMVWTISCFFSRGLAQHPSSEPAPQSKVHFTHASIRSENFMKVMYTMYSMNKTSASYQ
mmetsp:Transcript_125087/g.354048  ORF Transcript_125087/g.354048 Transcript_125087/m.354048 type:complete len:238 (-) Transcript_125087:123-836(-)